ncbi:MAG: hypothetical protein ACFFC0_00760 [Promethearchaeota archaeon]
MRRNRTTVLLALMLAIGFLIPLAIVPFAGAAAADLPEYIGVTLESGLAGEVAMPEISADDYVSADMMGFMEPSDVGAVAYDWYLGAATYSPWMTLRGISEYCEVWVSNDLSYPAGDPRNADPDTWQVTDEQCQYLADEFDAVIYQECSEFFGPSADRDGMDTIFEALGWPEYYYNWTPAEDNPQRVILKVLNIRDEGFYDPTYPYFVIGFFSSTYNGYYDRNIIHIDNWQWWRRLGEEGHQWLPHRPDLLVERPYTYEGTVAHEYQHLIHRDYQPSPAAFMNEGCSMFAEVLCGYGIPWSHINSFLATPDNSLTEWEDQGGINVLADYGQAALWTIYLADHYGAELLSYYVGAGISGIEGIDAALAHFGYSETFDDVFHNWRLANLIHSDWPGCGKYNYKTLDLGSEEADPLRIYEIEGIPVPWTMGSDFGTTVTNLGYEAEGLGALYLGPYGTDYIALNEWKKHRWGQKKLRFNGDNFAYVDPGLQWTFLADVGLWYSGADNLMNTVIADEAYVDPGDPMLTLTTYWDIEDFWDFGFVQVSTDDGATWTSLENEYTTYDHDPGAHPNVLANLPGLTSWSGYITADGWVDMSFDLTAYAGQTVLIGFRYVTDWNTLYEGWYLDTPSVSGVALELAEWYALPPEADFMVSFVYFAKCKGNYYPVWVSELCLDDMTEEGRKWLPISKPMYVVVVVSAIHDVGVADYEFKVGHGYGRCPWWYM